ncbi:hypothetical protein HHJ78_03345 [Mobiluncus mulieris]|uniref:Uncharacterized protein n=1 Tax=Mobiluncus mulieris TaxID=2052 RepID=A0A7Y0U0L5_9ACTO|nr:hypothetical protein [Mobiluncus mulieris]NMX02809.1 hypothetical protein [Mobiluncus mulieris]
MYGVDVSAEYKARRWRKLLVLIDQLPSASRFAQAYLTDENNSDRLALAQLEAEKDTDNNHGSMSFREWDLQASQLAILIDAIHALNATVMAVGGGKPPHIEPFPRPQTAGEKALDKARAEAMDDFVNLITPGRSPS